MKEHLYSPLSQSTEVNQEETAASQPDFLSQLMFSWLSATMRLGYSRPLEEDDVPLTAVGQEDTADLVFKLQRTLDETSLDQEGRNRKLWRCLLPLMSSLDYVMYICTMLGESVCRFTQPVMMSLLLWELSNNPDRLTRWSLVLTSCLAVTLFLQPFLKAHYDYTANVIAAKLIASLRGIMYHKILNANQQSLNNIGSGKIVSLNSKDLKPIQPFVKRFPHVFVAPVEVFGLSVLLWWLVGVEALAGLVYLLLIAFYLFITYKPLKTLRKETSKLTATRLTQIENVVNAMRLVKMNTWEEHFLNTIGKVRRDEMKVIWYRSIFLASIMAIVSSVPVFPSFVSLVTLMLTGHSLTPQVVFTTVLLMSTIELSFAGYCYQGAYYATLVAASIERVEKFLFQDDDRERKSLHSKNLRTDFSKSHPCVSLSQVTSTAGNKSTVVLNNVTVTFQGNAFVGVTGPVGCGKTSLLRAIAGELETQQGKIYTSTASVYVSQIPWLFSGTLRDNIVFGEEYDSERFENIIKACALKEDLERFPAGDLTFVGERGITLSGGQRARVGLARALYSNADIYLLDDPLSALDSNVGAHIVDKCLGLHGLLADKLVILVTHRLQYLQSTDRIIVMKNGCVVKEMTYSELARTDDQHLDGSETPFEKKPSDGCCEAEEADTASERSADSSVGTEAEVGVDEDRHYGGVSWRTYWRYVHSGSSLAFLVILTIVVILPEAFDASSNVWLSHWTELPQQEKREPSNLYIYCAIVGGSAILQFVRAFTVFFAALRSSEILHKSMLFTVFKAPVRFFDTSPTGRILNRFSMDVDNMDERLPRDLLDVLRNVVFTCIAVVLVSLLNFWVAIPALPVVILVCLLCRYFLRTSRETKRLSLITASPVFSHFVETIQGIETIRAHDKEKDFLRLLCRHQDHNTREWLIFNATQAWFGLRVDLLIAVFSTVVIFSSILLNSSTGVAGISITYAIQLVNKCLLTMITFARIENWMTSTQRVLNYTELEPEAGYQTTKQAPEGWSKTGQLHFQQVSLCYYPGGPKALEDVSCIIEAGEKIGLVGRTGAGKSSLVASLFRMPDHDGKIYLGDVCLSELNLQEARSALTAIPQDPLFFTGTLRSNLDPFNEYGDQEIWDALDKVQMKELLENIPDKLEYHVTERGKNFSVGERQLLCLARAMLQKKKVLVFDEATANVDYDTERLIHDTLKDQLKDCTVLTIAHRMTNVMQYDKVLVLDKGRLVEFDKPGVLINRKDSIFARLVSSQTT